MTTATRTILFFLLGAVFGGLAVAIALRLPGEYLALLSLSGTEATNTSGDALPSDTSGRVTVADQLAGDAVAIEAVEVLPPGVWVAVREVAGGVLGNVLGAARVRGSVESLSVPLLRATLPGHAYAVVLYRDDGDDLFSLEGDSVYVDFDTGAPVVAPFSARL